MTRPGIEPWSPGPLANTLTARLPEFFSSCSPPDDVPYLLQQLIFSKKVTHVCYKLYVVRYTGFKMFMILTVPK